MNNLWNTERRLWQEGVSAYEEIMAPECVMVFGPVGIMRRPEIIQSMSDAARWSEVEISDTTQTTPAENVSVVAYRVLARRPDAETYEAFCMSTYIKFDGSWRLAQHQQSVVQRA